MMKSMEVYNETLLFFFHQAISISKKVMDKLFNKSIFQGEVYSLYTFATSWSPVGKGTAGIMKQI